mgnify:FL=1
MSFYKFILIGENILNFHSDDDSYYEEWVEDIRDMGGWIVALNIPEQTKHDFLKARIQHYIHFMEDDNWRTFNPMHLFEKIDNALLE